MSTNVYTDGKALVTQYAAGTVSQSADPVLLKTQSAPGVAPHFNISTSINNAAGTVYDHNTEVAHSESYLGQGQHAPVVIVGRNTGMLNGDNGFLSWMKSVYIEKRNAVMHEVDTAVNAVWSKLAPGLQNAISNGEKIVSGMTLQDFGDAAQDDAKAMMDALMSKDTLIALGQTAVMMGIAAIPVVGEIADGAAVVMRVKGAIESVQGASEELKEMVDRWSKPMTPEQLAVERKKLASWLIKVGISVILAALGKAVAKLSGRAKGKENSSEKIEVGKNAKPNETTCACATGHPVIIATGEKALTENDFALPGTIPLNWTRKYRSGSTHDSWFGQGWSMPLSVALTIFADRLSYQDEAGRSIPLPFIKVGVEYFDVYEEITLRRPSDDLWEIVFKSGRIEYFKRTRPDLFLLPLMGIADRNDNRIVLHYSDPSDDPFEPWRPHALTDSVGRRLQLTWDERGHLTFVSLSLGDKFPPLASYRYSDAGDLILHADAGGAQRSYEWRNHVLIAYTQQDAARYCAEYDEYSPSGRVLRSYADADGRGLSFQYNARARTTSVTDTLGRTTRYEYDARKDIVATTFPGGARDETPYDTNGNPRQAADPLDRQTHYRFDRRGNLIEIVDPSGARTALEYNDHDLPIKLTDALKNVWRRDYDTNGNLVQVIDPLEQITRYEYDQRGLPTRIIDARGGIKQLKWDNHGNLASHTDCSDQTTRFTYNAVGRLQTHTDALGNVTQYHWNAAGHLVQMTEATGATHRYAWSKQGRLLAYTDPLGAITRYTYNGHGEPIERTDANGNRLRYAHDQVGRLSHLTNENGETTHFGYDIADWLIDEIGFDGRHQRYCYNAAGEPTHLIEAGGSDAGPGKVTRFERDIMGRLKAKYAEGDRTCDAEYEYDALGQLTNAKNLAANVAFAYDPLGQVLSETQALSGSLPSVISHRYDELGNRTQTVLPKGRTLNWLFYGSGHLHQINLEQDGRHRLIADIERDALHREIVRSQGNIQSRYEYDPMGRLTRHKASIAGSNQQLGKDAQIAVERSYRYDDAGNLTAKLDALRGQQNYRYDPAGRVLATSGRQEEFFAFDPAGNILPFQQGKMSGRVSGNRLETYQDLRYTYDAHGNVVTRDRGAHEHAELSWNADHQLRETSVARHGVTQSTRYEYDALGRRTRKSSTFGTTECLWDGDLMIESRFGHKTSLFIFEPNSFVPLATIQDDQTYWYQCDQIGAPQELTDVEGKIVWAADYTVWGNATLRKTGTNNRGVQFDWQGLPLTPSSQPQINQPFRFQGQQFDEETGLHYNRFRYYDPGCGRYVSNDPIGLNGGNNLYLYSTNPAKWIDPFGLAPKPPSTFAVQDGTGATPQEIAASKVGGGNRSGQAACRQKLLNANTTGVYKCWRCGHTSTNPADMHLGHKNVPTSKGGNLADENVDLEGASCNLSAGNSGYVKQGMSCVERGSCGAPYGR
jgi:RHS repeat-associated protein